MVFEPNTSGPAGPARHSVTALLAACTGAARSRAHRGGVVLRPVRRQRQPPSSQALGRLVARSVWRPPHPWSTSCCGCPGRGAGTAPRRVAMAEDVELLQTFQFQVHPDPQRPGRHGFDARRRCVQPSAAGCSWKPTSRSTWRVAATTAWSVGSSRVKLPPTRAQARDVPVPAQSAPGALHAAARPPGTGAAPTTGSSAADTADTALWDWLTAMVSSVQPMRRYNGQDPVCWTPRSRPARHLDVRTRAAQKVIGPTLNAQTGDIAMEEMQIVHEGLRLGGPGHDGTRRKAKPVAARRDQEGTGKNAKTSYLAAGQVATSRSSSTRRR